jgi:hypothetical protein
MKAMDSDLSRLVTSYVLRVTPKISSWYRLSSWGAETVREETANQMQEPGVGWRQTWRYQE